MGSTSVSELKLSLLAGRTIEQAVKDAIKERYSVVMTGNIETAAPHGPRLEDATNGVVLADMQLYKGVRAGWVEVKSKSSVMYFRKKDRYEHGIDLDKLNQYWRLQNDTGQPVYLLICELSSGAVLMQSLSTLGSQGKPRKGCNTSDRKEMISFIRDAFAVVGAISVPTEDLRKMSVVINWEVFETFVTQPRLLED